jgi:hypothetical protein
MFMEAGPDSEGRIGKDWGNVKEAKMCKMMGKFLGKWAYREVAPMRRAKVRYL